MADLSDVVDKLGSQVESIVYPNGTSQPSIAGIGIQIGPGWPLENELNDYLVAGNVMVSIFPTAMERDKTTFQRTDIVSSVNTPTLTVTVSSNTVTVGGTVTLPQSVMLIVNKVGYAYAVLNADTLSTIASALAALIPGATAVGPVITISGAYSIVGRIAVQAQLVEILSRMDRVFMISVWAPTRNLRTLVAKALKTSLDATPRLTLADNTDCQVVYKSTYENDTLQRSRLYRRDLCYRILYMSTATTTAMTVTDVNSTITAGSAQ